MSPGMGKILSLFLLHFEGVTFHMYRDTRALFIMDLPMSLNFTSVDEDLREFDFHRILVDTLENNLADIIKAEWELWVVAIGLIAIPPGYSIPSVLLCVGISMLHVIGMTLVHISPVIIQHRASSWSSQGQPIHARGIV